MTGHSRDQVDHCPMSFLKYITAEYHAKFQAQWRKLLSEKSEVSCELRLQKMWKPENARDIKDQEQEPAWILFLAVPQWNEDGTLIKVFGCVS